MTCTKMGKALYHIQEGLLETVGSQLQDQAAEGEPSYGWVYGTNSYANKSIEHQHLKFLAEEINIQVASRQPF